MKTISFPFTWDREPKTQTLQEKLLKSDALGQLYLIGDIEGLPSVIYEISINAIAEIERLHRLASIH